MTEADRVIPEKRFYRFLKYNNGCWNWMGSKSQTGYGGFALTRRNKIGAHRFSWKYFRGPIPAGMCVLHKCDNPSCVNPAHLFLGNSSDNMKDMFAKHRRTTAGSKNPRAKLTDAEAQEIRQIYFDGSAPQKGLADKFGVSQQAISRIVCQTSYKENLLKGVIK